MGNERGSRVVDRGHRVAAALVGLLLGGSCNVGPNFVRPKVALNADWRAQGDQRLATQTPIDRTWWRLFNDPTLDRLIELAYEQNLPLQVSGLRIFEARAQLGIAVGEQLPQNPGPLVNAGMLGLRGTNGARNFAGYQVGFDAVWELDFWGKYRRGTRAAKANYWASLADYDNALVLLAAEVARTYAVIRTFEVLIDQGRQNVGVQDEGLRLSNSRFKNGATSYLDVTQATNLLESTRASIPKLELGLTQAENALCTLLGRPSGCARPLLDGPHAIPTTPAQVAVSIPAEMLRRRPDIRSAELRALAQSERIGMAKADLYPSLGVSGSIGTGGLATAGDTAFLNFLGFDSLFSLVYNFGARLFWPVLNYPKILNNVRVQDARLQQLLVDYHHSVLKAAQEVDDGVAGFLQEQESAAFALMAANAAEESVKLALKQYREGALDYQRVLDTQRVLLAAQDTLARTRSATVTNLIALYKALGGGWELRDGQPVISAQNRAEMEKRTNWGSYFKKLTPAQNAPRAPTNANRKVTHAEFPF